MFYVVICKVEGCEECGTSFNVIGVFTTPEAAEKAEDEHYALKKEHLHYPYVDTVKIEELDKAYHHWYAVLDNGKKFEHIN